MEQGGKETETLSRRSVRRHSGSFYLTLTVIAMTLVYFYMPVFFDTRDTVLKYYSYVTHAVMLFAAFLVAIRCNVKAGWDLLFLYLAFLLFFSVSYLLNRSGMGQLLDLTVVLLCLFALQADPLRKGERPAVVLLFALFAALVLLNGKFGNVRLGEIGNRFNPNTCGIVLCMFFCACVAEFFADRHVAFLLLAALAFAMQFLYLSRSALLGEVVFTALLLALRARKKTFRAGTVFWTVLLVSALGVVFAWFYADVLYRAVGHGKVAVFGKDLFTGRQRLWSLTLASVREHFFFGVGSRIGGGAGETVTNVHNQALGMLASFGIFVFLLFYALLARIASLGYGSAGRRPSFDRMPAAFLVTVIVMSYFEMFFVSQYCWGAMLVAYSLIASLGRLPVSVKDGDAEGSPASGLGGDSRLL